MASPPPKRQRRSCSRGFDVVKDSYIYGYHDQGPAWSSNRPMNAYDSCSVVSDDDELMIATTLASLKDTFPPTDERKGAIDACNINLLFCNNGTKPYTLAMASDDAGNQQIWSDSSLPLTMTADQQVSNSSPEMFDLGLLNIFESDLICDEMYKERTRGKVMTASSHRQMCARLNQSRHASGKRQKVQQRTMLEKLEDVNGISQCPRQHKDLRQDKDRTMLEKLEEVKDILQYPRQYKDFREDKEMVDTLQCAMMDKELRQMMQTEDFENIMSSLTLPFGFKQVKRTIRLLTMLTSASTSRKFEVSHSTPNHIAQIQKLELSKTVESKIAFKLVVDKKKDPVDFMPCHFLVDFINVLEAQHEVAYSCLANAKPQFVERELLVRDMWVLLVNLLSYDDVRREMSECGAEKVKECANMFLSYTEDTATILDHVISYVEDSVFMKSDTLNAMSLSLLFKFNLTTASTCFQDNQDVSVKSLARICLRLLDHPFETLKRSQRCCKLHKKEARRHYKGMERNDQCAFDAWMIKINP